MRVGVELGVVFDERGCVVESDCGDSLVVAELEQSPTLHHVGVEREGTVDADFAASLTKARVVADSGARIISVTLTDGTGTVSVNVTCSREWFSLGFYSGRIVAFFEGGEWAEVGISSSAVFGGSRKIGAPGIATVLSVPTGRCP